MKFTEIRFIIAFITLTCSLNAQENIQLSDSFNIVVNKTSDSCYCIGKKTDQKKVGVWVFYSTESNDIYKIASYKNDTLNGHVYCIRKDGTIKMDLCYKNGYLNGWSIFYNSKCEIIGRIFYINSIGTYWSQMAVDKESPPLNKMYVPECECPCKRSTYK